MRIDPDPDGEHRRRRAARGRRRASRERTWRWLAVGGLLLAFLPALLPRWFTPPWSAFMVAAWLQAWRSGEAGFRLTHQPVPLAAIAPELALAVIAAEDQRFPDHDGFDLRELRRVLQQDGQSPSRGASTISQQTVKNLYLWSGPSWLRKGIEAWYTLWLERFCTKRRILELYLTFAEFGRGVYGAEAASRSYFGKPARRLTAAEAALLAAVLPAPRSRSVQDPSPLLRVRQHWVLRQMAQLGGTAALSALR